MSPEVKAWYDLAESDYGAAHREHRLSAGPNIVVVCFHAQQCAEKLIKAFLVARGVVPPKSHDLTALAGLVAKTADPPKLDQADLDVLEPGAVIYRYPGLLATAENAKAALGACERVRSQILPLL